VKFLKSATELFEKSATELQFLKSATELQQWFLTFFMQQPFLQPNLTYLTTPFQKFPVQGIWNAIVFAQ